MTFKKNLIIYAHPDIGGHCYRILKDLEKKFIEAEKSYEVIDLYKESYDPILHENELYTAGNKDISLENREYQEKIKYADNLIFIFPIWWGHMPAILKGFIDRVFTPGFAFKYKKFIGNVYIPHGLLKNKKALIFMTGGGRKIFYFLNLARSPKKILKKMIFNFCGLKTKVLELHDATNVEKNLEKIKQLVDKGFNWLF